MNLELLATSALAGLFAAFSPCSLPVYPVILNMLSRGGVNRKLSAVAFAMGLAMAFSLFYAAVGFTLRWAGEEVLSAYMNAVYLVAYAAASIICLLFALQSTGVLKFYGRTFAPKAGFGGGVFGAVLTGAFFATVVSPCNVGFLVVGILPVLLSKSTVFEGLMLMFAFSFSLSLPMLALGLFSSHAMDTWVRKHVRLIERASAVFLLAASFYFLWLAYNLYSPS